MKCHSVIKWCCISCMLNYDWINWIQNILFFTVLIRDNANEIFVSVILLALCNMRWLEDGWHAGIYALLLEHREACLFGNFSFRRNRLANFGRYFSSSWFYYTHKKRWQLLDKCLCLFMSILCCQACALYNNWWPMLSGEIKHSWNMILVYCIFVSFHWWYC